jgi:hypothetical protein
MPSVDPNSDGTPQLFSGIHLFLAQSLSAVTLDHLRELLAEHGGTEVEHAKAASHVISLSDCFIGVEEAKEAIVVTVCGITCLLGRSLTVRGKSLPG